MKERLIGGMALPRGVLFMTEERLAAGYYDKEGQLRLHTQPVSLHCFRWAGLLGRAILLPLEAWRLGHDRGGCRPDRGQGAPGGGHNWIPHGALATEWTDPSMGALLHLPGPAGAALLPLPPFRRVIQQVRRYHAAEHMAVHALMKTDGLPTLAEVRPQPMLHPGCGTNLVMLSLPLMLLGFFLPYWLSLLLLLPALNLFVWMNHHPEHPLARRLLALGYAGQRLNPGPSPQDRRPPSRPWRGWRQRTPRGRWRRRAHLLP